MQIANLSYLLKSSDRAFKALKMFSGVQKNFTNAFAKYLYHLDLYASFRMARARCRSGASNSLFGQRDLLY